MQIQVTYAGSDGLWIDELVRLRVTTELGELVDDAPYIYQLSDGVEVEVAGQFELVDADTYTFAITGEYDPAIELVIDPDLDWGRYLGGSGTEYAFDAAILAAHFGMTLPPPGEATPSEPLTPVEAPVELVLVDVTAFFGPWPVGNAASARRSIQAVERLGGLGLQQREQLGTQPRADALRSPGLRSPDELLIEMVSESSTAALDVALAEEYGPGVEQSGFLNRHAAWSSMVARRQAARREDTILDRAALAVDLLLAE